MTRILRSPRAACQTNISVTSVRLRAIDSAPFPLEIDALAVARFRAKLAEHDLLHEKLGVAVSGGPDSLALLLLADAAVPGSVEAATVDHGLRAESASEAAFVAELCVRLELPHTILKATVKSGNLQSEARTARYTALGAWREHVEAKLIMTAHHADDQAETLLMRLNRGSGLGGLVGIRTMTTIPGSKGQLFRPLLDWRKAELEAIVGDAGLDPVIDPSNVDDSFDRARVRKEIAKADWLDVVAIAQSAAHLEQALAAFEVLARGQWDTQVKRVGKRYVYRPSGPDQVQLMVMERVISALGKRPTMTALTQLRSKLLEGQKGNLAGVLVTPIDRVWRFEVEPPRNTS